MRTITLEEHVSFPELTSRIPIPDHAFSPSAVIQKAARLLEDTSSDRIDSMDRNGISVQVLSVAGPGAELLGPTDGPAFAAAYNDLLAKRVQLHPDRFAAFAHLPMTNPVAAADELDRVVSEYGFKGALISGMTNGMFLDDSTFAPLLRRAESLNIPLYLHPGLPPKAVADAYYQGLPKLAGIAMATSGWGWHSETALHVLRLIVSGTLDRYPALRIIIGHMGEMLPMMTARCDDKFGVAKTGLNERSVSETLRQQVYVTTSGVFSQAPLLAALEAFGIDNLLFSVDYPFSSNEQGRAFLDSLPFSEGDRTKIAFKNAERLLGM